MTNARYDIYLNFPGMGIIHAMDCVIQEKDAVVERVAFRYTDPFLKHPGAFPLDPIQLPLTPEEKILKCNVSCGRIWISGKPTISI